MGADQRTPNSEFRMGNLSRRDLMKADGNSFPEFILGWTIGAIGVWPSQSDAMTIARHFNAGLVVKSIQVPEGRQRFAG
jgi:hypothetical protein